MRQKFIYNRATDRMVEVSTDYTPRPRLAIIGDSAPAFKSMADGQMYDSKSRYRSELKARGYEELGNDRNVTERPEPTDATADLYQAFTEHGI